MGSSIFLFLVSDTKTAFDKNEIRRNNPICPGTPPQKKSNSQKKKEGIPTILVGFRNAPLFQKKYLPCKEKKGLVYTIYPYRGLGRRQSEKKKTPNRPPQLQYEYVAWIIVVALHLLPDLGDLRSPASVRCFFFFFVCTALACWLFWL